MRLEYLVGARAPAVFGLYLCSISTQREHLSEAALPGASSRGSGDAAMPPSHAGSLGCPFQGMFDASLKSSLLVRYLPCTGLHHTSCNVRVTTSGSG